MDSQDKAAVEVRDVNSSETRPAEDAKTPADSSAPKTDGEQKSERGDAAKKAAKEKCAKKHSKSKSKKSKKRVETEDSTPSLTATRTRPIRLLQIPSQQTLSLSRKGPRRGAPLRSVTPLRRPRRRPNRKIEKAGQDCICKRP